ISTSQDCPQLHQTLGSDDIDKLEFGGHESDWPARDEVPEAEDDAEDSCSPSETSAGYREVEGERDEEGCAQREQYRSELPEGERDESQRKGLPLVPCFIGPPD